jgi:hypothetical protein
MQDFESDIRRHWDSVVGLVRSSGLPFDYTADQILTNDVRRICAALDFSRAMGAEQKGLTEQQMREHPAKTIQGFHKIMMAFIPAFLGNFS